MRLPALLFITGSVALAAATGLPGCRAMPTAKPAPSPENARKIELNHAYKTVKETKLFAIGGISFGGELSDGEVAIRKIAAGPDAVGRCLSLTKVATPEGRLYGLFGLKLLDDKAYQSLCPSFQKDTTRIHFAGGCLYFDDTVAGATETIQKRNLK